MRQTRCAVANQFLVIISEHGRCFFRHHGVVTKFVLDKRGRVWLVHSYTGKRVYTHCDGAWRGFTQGGTLKDVCVNLREYIMGRSGLPLSSLGPWPKWVCDGDPWGYGGKSMEAVRHHCAVLAGKSGHPADQEES